MPLIEVTLVQGRTPEQLRTLITGLTQAAVDAVDAPLAAVRVVARVQMPGGGDLLDAFLRAGLGRGYQGRQRESWCQALAP